MHLPRSKRARFLAGVFLLLICCGSWGCRSTQEGSPSAFASVIIKERPLTEIRDVTCKVFEKHGYMNVTAGKKLDFIFEKEGTKMNTLTYGGWMGKIWVRVKVYVEPEAGDAYLLRCDAYMVADHGDPFVEEEHKLTRMKRGTYQDLMAEIKATLGLSAAK
jgi:hypothetical protein